MEKGDRGSFEGGYLVGECVILKVDQIRDIIGSEGCKEVEMAWNMEDEERDGADGLQVSKCNCSCEFGDGRVGNDIHGWGC